MKMTKKKQQNIAATNFTLQSQTYAHTQARLQQISKQPYAYTYIHICIFIYTHSHQIHTHS